jgi:hypothetical protein
VSSVGDIGMQLKYLQGQDVWSSRSRIHIMATSHPPHTPCVYLGKNGLLGGRENRQRAPLQTNEEWISGPTMILSSNTTRTEAYHIPRNYRYKSYRVKDGAVVQHASYTIRYVEANSLEVIQSLEGLKDDRDLNVILAVNFAKVISLGKFEAGVRHDYLHDHQSFYRSQFTHAALVVHGRTENDRLFRNSKLELELEILVEKIKFHLPWTYVIPILISSAAALSYFVTRIRNEI